MPFLLFCSSPLAVILAFVLCRGRSGTLAHRVGQLLALSGCVGSLWASYWLFEGGQRTHWQSDGAGILFVMIAMVILVVIGLVFGVILFHSISRDDPEEEDRLAGFRAVLAALFLLFLAFVAGWVAWRYYQRSSSRGNGALARVHRGRAGVSPARTRLSATPSARSPRASSDGRR